MILEVIPDAGIGRSQPLVIRVSQVVLRTDDGTPICCAAHYGFEGCYRVAKVGDKDFAATLKALGITETVIVENLELPSPPPGARLVARPSYEEDDVRNRTH